MREEEVPWMGVGEPSLGASFLVASSLVRTLQSVVQVKSGGKMHFITYRCIIIYLDTCICLLTVPQIASLLSIILVQITQ